ncbi:putative serum paraoxonase arylesterase 2 [Rosellinia necatrix]|uniref:Putative serum paraoxonase arylesterase 2 n=1 Tax=Rosellinia necatrix TaxID=77044 RepID=A0A1W2TIK5_ROSNE|nr:putative serum paraoxonase arylesterase 2 [Rosellinia necatrix]
MAVFSYLIVTLVGVLGAWLYPPIRHFTTILGFRPFESTLNVHGTETRFIPDTVACEDLEYHAPSGMLYTACVGDLETARGWNPGAEALDRPDRPAYGSIMVIDPKTLKSQKLSLEGFEGPFATHGIALHTPPSEPGLVYIFAVNHLPNPRWTGSETGGWRAEEEKAASRVELFAHAVGSGAARHVRSIAHPLIRTPNDLLAVSPTEFLVTNDHRYRAGWRRLLEEFARAGRGWTDLIHVRLHDSDGDGDGDGEKDAAERGVDAAVALDSIPTNNGLGWGPDRQVVIGDAVGGHVYFASLPDEQRNGNRTMAVSHYFPVDCVVDNPTFFADPYAAATGRDYSGYLMPGLSDGLRFRAAFDDPAFEAPIPGQVWYLPAAAGRDAGAGVDVAAAHRLLFRDDGRAIRSVTTAVLVAIDPAANAGRREGWLFVTSVIGARMLATKIDFETALA